eukprot:994866-Amphidinium_carterae.1
MPLPSLVCTQLKLNRHHKKEVYPAQRSRIPRCAVGFIHLICFPSCFHLARVSRRHGRLKNDKKDIRIKNNSDDDDDDDDDDEDEDENEDDDEDDDEDENEDDDEDEDDDDDDDDDDDE